MFPRGGEDGDVVRPASDDDDSRQLVYELAHADACAEGGTVAKQDPHRVEA
jgi:hypothetical protein